MCLIFFSCRVPSPPTLMPVGLLLVQREARGGSRAALGVCVHGRGGGSTLQATTHEYQVSLASWVVCIGRAESWYFWLIAKVATKVGFISHSLLGMCNWLLCTPVMSVLNCPHVQTLTGLAFTFSHGCLCTSFYIKLTHICSHTYPKNQYFLNKRA